MQAVEKTTFKPDFRGKGLTEKFYARHECLDFNKGFFAANPNVVYYMEEILKRLKYDPREHLIGPITENQVYGWIEHKAIKYRDPQDLKLMFYPRSFDELMGTLMKISVDVNRQRRFK